MDDSNRTPSNDNTDIQTPEDALALVQRGVAWLLEEQRTVELTPEGLRENRELLTMHREIEARLIRNYFV